MVLLDEWHIQLLLGADHDNQDITALAVDTCDTQVQLLVALLRQRLAQALPGVAFEIVVDR